MQELKEKYASVNDYQTEPAFSDAMKVKGTIAKTGKEMKTKADEIIRDYMSFFLEALSSAPRCDISQKRDEVKKYVDGLFANGSPTVKQFDKILGREKAVDMYSKYVFFSDEIKKN